MYIYIYTYAYVCIRSYIYIYIYIYIYRPTVAGAGDTWYWLTRSMSEAAGRWPGPDFSALGRLRAAQHGALRAEVIYIYIYIYAQPPQNLPFQYSHLSRVQPSNSFVDVILSFCRREWWDIALHRNALH